MPQDTSQLVVAGTGRVMVAPVGTAAPSDPVSAWPAGWLDLGYTSEAGVKFHDDKKLLELGVWQLFYPARRIIIGRDSTISFSLQQWSGSAVTFAYGGGTIATTAGLLPMGALSSSTLTTGGQLVPGTYGYRVSAINAIGETLASAEKTQVVPSGTNTNTVTVTWSSVTGATGYKVYARTPGQELLLATLGVVLTYTDLGAIVPSGPLPTQDTTPWYQFAPPAPGTADPRALGIEWTDGAFQFRLLAQKGLVFGANDVEIVRTKQADLDVTFGVTGTQTGNPFTLMGNHPALAS